jgi:hypothetical protein
VIGRSYHFWTTGPVVTWVDGNHGHDQEVELVMAPAWAVDEDVDNGEAKHALAIQRRSGSGDPVGDVHSR